MTNALQSGTAVVKPGHTAVSHRLKASEVYYILEGESIMNINDEARDVHPGQAVYIPQNSRQYCA